jgi:Tol biopolymer transport system component/tRNA A-37 threonylcarbamoyl transferase component Bud32
MTDPARWSRVKGVFDAALEREPHDRAAYILQTCGDDAVLKADVESLLSAHQEAGNFAEQPAILALSDAIGGGAGIAVNRAFEPGDRIGSYEIVSFLAAGGMGEVYRALDPALGREVAVKVISPLIAGDAERLARFEREGRVLAALNHPNIASIYAVEEGRAGDGSPRRAIVMELVDGETLAERIPRAGMAVNEALVITRQLIDALDAAHGRSIVHRDLKPANVKITSEGTIKVLDFGLAKRRVVEHERTASDDHGGELSLASNASADNAVFGTVAYMSPEQMRGEPTDKRTDIWSFGCVLFEMLSGRPPFRRDTAPETMASILEREPDWEVLPAATPAVVRTLLRHCLQKDRGRRLRDIADARFLVDQATASPTESVVAGPTRWRERAAWATVVVLMAAALVATNMFFDRGTPGGAAPEMRLQIPTPAASDLNSLAISPNGETIVFEAIVDGRMSLWLRPLASETARPLAGTEDALDPFWSPDGRSIGFFTFIGDLKRIDLESQVVRTLEKAADAKGGTWGLDGTILFEGGTGPLLRASADSGGRTEATRLLPGQTNHRWPHFLPDGRRFLFTATGASHANGLYLGTLGTMTSERLSDVVSAATFVPPHYVMFARHGALWAQQIDVERATLVDDSMLVAPRVLVHPVQSGGVALSASPSSRVAYRAGADRRQLTWLDRSGAQIATLGETDSTQAGDLRMSPDGTTVALRRTVDGNSDLWLMDTVRGVPRRLTFDPGIDFQLVFSPDGRRVAYLSDQQGQLNDIYGIAVDGVGDKQLLIATPAQENVYDWSPDGHLLLYGIQDSSDLWILPLTGNRKPYPIVQSPFAELNGRFSPDGRWIAYQSDESGRSEVYVQRLGPEGRKLRISPAGGSNPEWSGTGTELFYLSADTRLMSVPLDLNTLTLTTGVPAALFSMPVPFHRRAPYAVTPDGHRFLVNRIISDPEPLTVLFNWKPPAPDR